MTTAEELESWVVRHICDTYPDLTLERRRAIYKASPPLRQAYPQLKAAGDATAEKAAARAVYIAWTKALRIAQDVSAPQVAPETRPPTIVPPGPQEDLPMVHHSVVLDTDILVCHDAQTAKRYWDHPEQGVAYTLAELRLLKRVRDANAAQFPEVFAWIHDTKQQFGGFLEKILDKDGKS